MNLANIEILDYEGILTFSELDIDEAAILWAKWIDTNLHLSDIELEQLNKDHYDFVEEYVRNHKIG